MSEKLKSKWYFLKQQICDKAYNYCSKIKLKSFMFNIFWEKQNYYLLNIKMITKHINNNSVSL